LIIAKVPLPTNNCGSYSANNPVASLSTERLSYSNGSAVFHAEGTVEIWDCRQNPTPNVEKATCWTHGWIKTKFPCLHTWPGSPIKNKLVSQPFAIDIPFGLRVVTAGGGVQLVPGQANLNLSGQYSNITKGFLDTFRINVSNILTNAIQKAIDPSKVTAEIPKDIAQAGVSFKRAEFVSDFRVNLGVDAVADVKLTTSAAKEGVRLLYEKIRSKL
jgi:hypothetical protein